jgi:hypothetical protein
MKTIHHRYGVRSEYVKAGSLVGVVFFLLGAFFLCIGLWSLTDVANSGFSAFLGSLIYFTLFSLLIPFCCVFAYYLYSDIDVDEKGLFINFFRKAFRVSWDDVLEVKPIKPKIWASFVGTVIEERYLVITSSQLSIFHRLYGIVFGRTSAPSFLVTSLISQAPDLMDKLRAKSNLQNTLSSTETTLI